MIKHQAYSENEITKRHPFGLKGLLKVYQIRKLVKNPSFYIAFLMSAILFIFFILSDISANKLLEIILSTVEIGLALDGGLLGLSLAGLTLIVTFGSEKLLKSMITLYVKKIKENNVEVFYSGYQTAVSKFGFAVFVQVLTLIILFFYNLILKFDLSFTDIYINKIINSFYLAFAIFLIIYSLFLVVQMTINIFTISQMNHSVYFSECISEDIKINASTPDTSDSSDSSECKDK